MATRAPPQNRGDVVIDDVKYPLYLDPKTNQLVWRHEGSMPIQEGDPAEELTAIWDNGWFGGMGETKRVAQDSVGYAHSAGMDCSTYGFARLAPRFVSVTPTHAPVNKPTYFMEASPTGSAVFNVGSFVKDHDDPGHLGTHSQTGISHGLSVTPKAIIFWTAGDESDGTVTAGFRTSYGYTDGTTERAQGGSSEDNVGTTVCNSAYEAKSILLVIDGGTYPEGSAANIGSSTFDINWINNDTGEDIIHFMAIGGPGVYADVIEWAMPTETGEEAVTGASGKPEVVLHLSTTRISVGGASGFLFQRGAMDASGNQWAQYSYSGNGAGTSSTFRVQATDLCITDHTTPKASFVSMDSAGFTVNFTAAENARLVASLCLRGVRAKVGTWDKSVDGTDAVTGVGFQPTSLMLASVQNITASGPQDHNRLGLGASDFTHHHCSAISDTDALGTTSTDGVDDTGAVFIKINNDTQTIDAEGTVAATSDGFTVTWGTNDAVATEMLYVAMAATVRSVDKFMYCFNGTYSYKMSVAANVITVHEEKDISADGNFGGDVQAGNGVGFESEYYVALGDSVPLAKLTVADEDNTDTWDADGSAETALAFCIYQDGAVSKLLRAHSVNKIDLSADGSTWDGSDFEVGESTSKITMVADTGPMCAVAKEDNLYTMSSTGAAFQVTREVSSDPDNGVGLVGIPGTEACYYNHQAGLFLQNGDNVRNVSHDELPTLMAIPNISHEPFRGRHYEGTVAGDWVWRIYQVTESSVTKTYIKAGHRIGDRLTWHSPIRVDGAARGCFRDSAMRLWTTVGGKIGYYQIGQNGSPDAGRDAIGYGAASTGSSLYLPLTDLGLPHTTKQLRSVEVKGRNIDSTALIYIYVLRDGGAPVPLSAGNPNSGVIQEYWTLGTNDTAVDVMLMIYISCQAGYDPLTGDPQIWGVVLRATARPDKADRIHFTVNTQVRYKDGVLPTKDARDQRETLKALVEAAPVTGTDLDDNSITLKVLEVGDLEVRLDENGEVVYVIDCYAKEWISA